MKLNNTEITIIGADPDEVAAALNKEFPTRDALIGSTITAYGAEFVMLEENLGMYWISFFLKLMDCDTTGIAAKLGGTRLSVSWTFLENEN